MPKSSARSDTTQLRSDITDLLSDAIFALRQLLSDGVDAIDISEDPGKNIAEVFCLAANALPQLARVHDEVIEIRYGPAMSGVTIHGSSKRTTARFQWYYGLYGGVMFSTSLAHPELIYRATDEFWAGVSDLQTHGGTLAYEESDGSAHGAAASVRDRNAYRSAIFGLARDMVLATMEDAEEPYCFGQLSVSWPLATEAETLMGRMSGVLRGFNHLNQHLHRIAYLDSKGRERRKPTEAKM